MVVVDATTLTMTLKAKNAVFPQLMALMPFVGSPTAFRQLGADRFARAPVGGGPFVLRSWVPDAEMMLTRNPNYWNAPLPNLDQLVMRPVPDDTQRINSLCAAEANLIS